MTYTYTPKGVCSRKMTVELDEGGVIKAVRDRKSTRLNSSHIL